MTARSFASLLAVCALAACASTVAVPRPVVSSEHARDAEQTSESRPVVGSPHERDGEQRARREPMILEGPDLDGWAPSTLATTGADDPRYPLFAQARFLNAPIYVSRTTKWGRGVVRYGQFVRARRLRKRKGCPGGRWFELARGGYVCSARGFTILEDKPSRPQDATSPELDAALPYDYARVLRNEALRLQRPLTREQLERLSRAFDPNDPPATVETRMEGDYFLALAEQQRAPDGTAYYRTVRGHYVLAEELKPVSTPQMLGVPLEGNWKLPLGFVYGVDEVPLFRLGEDEQLERVGVAQKHARAEIDRRIELAGEAYWLTEDALLLPAEHVRVARARHRPDDVDEDERWLHINLAQQTLVAYEGSEPVYATLISSGKEGYDTAPGTFRVLHKYVSITMRGDDPVEGYYEVEEVPWTQYYDANFAVHGAYWHDDFGKVRSHGCTNVAPADARWLYHFTSPRVPYRWHGVRRPGTPIVITG